MSIYKLELARWNWFRPWRWIVLGFGLFTLVALACGIPFILYRPSDPLELSIGLATVMTLVVSQELLKMVMLLFAAVLGGIAGSNNTGDPSYALLTSVAPHSILSAKLRAILTVVLVPLLLVTALRVNLLFSAATWWFYDLQVMWHELSINRPPLPVVMIGAMANGLARLPLDRLDQIRIGSWWLWLFWVNVYVVMPALDTLLNLVVGMLGGSRAKTSTQAITRALGFMIAIAVFGYLGERLFLLLWVWPHYPEVRMALGNALLDINVTKYGTIASLWPLGFTAATTHFIFEFPHGFAALLIISITFKVGLLFMCWQLLERRFTSAQILRTN